MSTEKLYKFCDDPKNIQRLNEDQIKTLRTELNFRKQQARKALIRLGVSADIFLENNDNNLSLEKKITEFNRVKSIECSIDNALS
ncbi:hypothetical protein [Moorena sp. SIO3A2]|uniref:hypothetical protein n=1 Tax=Moorena sp. SIO3A2 TaxID=2607841 RepID=UPI0013B9822B|nr:hypothetical protein [Moorena sp. SIO3A2]NER91303.1 hypothetical protein [Moorena sp. SIO3A2]